MSIGAGRRRFVRKKCHLNEDAHIFLKLLGGVHT
jgi:hypothetical protein